MLNGSVLTLFRYMLKRLPEFYSCLSTSEFHKYWFNAEHRLHFLQNEIIILDMINLEVRWGCIFKRTLFLNKKYIHMQWNVYPLSTISLCHSEHPFSLIDFFVCLQTLVDNQCIFYYIKIILHSNDNIVCTQMITQCT